MKILQWLFPDFDERKASVRYEQAHLAARKQDDLINQSFDKEVTELSGYIEKEREKDFIEDMEALLKDYKYTKEFAAFLLSDSNKYTKRLENCFLDFAKTDFTCPYCGKQYNDDNDKYLDRCNKNKNWSTKIKCECGKYFYMTYDFKGDAVSFK